MSEVKVNKISPRSGTSLTIGDSGDTTNIVGTLQNNGAALVGDISSVVAGTNLSGGGTSGDVTINLADASTSAKGAASFSSDNFAASSGAVTIKDAGIATAEIQDNAVTTAKITDSNVTEAKVADNAITLAKMASGTDGNIISYDASGNPVAVATGSAGQVLTSAGAGAPPTFATGGISGWSSSSGSLLPASASAGIYLGVNSATAANLLDDYEEGTWTPLYVDNGNTQPTSYTNNSAGTYTKIGNTVTVWFDADFSSINNSNMSIYAGIGGYPFTASNSAGMTGTLAFYQTEFGTEEFCTTIEPNKTNGIFYHNGSTVSPGTIGTALRAFFQFTYKVA